VKAAPFIGPLPAFVTRLTTPPIACEPYRVLIGPRTTSMRSRFSVSKWAKSIAPLGEEGSFAVMPSISSSVWLELAPRTKMEVCVPGPPDCCTETPGTVRNTSAAVRSWRRCISSLVMTV
jgi:hypothetical protein